MRKNKEIEKLEPASFSFGRQAFSPKSVSCGRCGGKLKSKEIEVELEKGLYARLEGFECLKCGNRLLGLAQAEKLDRLMVLSKFSRQGFCMERSLSFDGDNYTLRIPKEFTYLVHDRKIDIVPLSKKEFYGRIR
jgi:hypothetical protein